MAVTGDLSPERLLIELVLRFLIKRESEKERQGESDGEGERVEEEREGLYIFFYSRKICRVRQRISRQHH